jgi:DNA-binding response OmpR family regulator
LLPGTKVQILTPEELLQRLQVLLSETQGALRSTEFKDKVEWKKVTKKADVADVIRVHEYNYVAWLQEQCEKLRTHEELAEKLAAAAAPAGDDA